MISPTISRDPDGNRDRDRDVGRDRGPDEDPDCPDDCLLHGCGPRHGSGSAGGRLDRLSGFRNRYTGFCIACLDCS